MLPLHQSLRFKSVYMGYTIQEPLQWDAAPVWAPQNLQVTPATTKEICPVSAATVCCAALAAVSTVPWSGSPWAESDFKCWIVEAQNRRTALWWTNQILWTNRTFNWRTYIETLYWIQCSLWARCGSCLLMACSVMYSILFGLSDVFVWDHSLPWFTCLLSSSS